MRDWQETDLSPWAVMNADTEVREHLGPPLTAGDAAASVRSFSRTLTATVSASGQLRSSGDFIGFRGLDPVNVGLPFTGVEAGWRLAPSAWGHGYASEAGLAVLEGGFVTVGLPEILAISTTTNLPSLCSDAADRHDPRPCGRLRRPRCRTGPLAPAGSLPTAC